MSFELQRQVMGTGAKREYQLLHKIRNILMTAADRIVVLSQKAENLPDKVPEVIALILYAAAHLGMAIVHEPFFDEAEAWQIARSVSLQTLLFETTHYEGHPPLWHLILMPFAKAGAPYELSLALVGLIFAGGAAFLILWYAPFPRLVRLLFPFTYFYFYQYGVISRVYCVMLLEFALLSMVYRGRNERPGRYVVILMLLCGTSAYGLVIAGGLALVWLWEIWDRQTVRGLINRWIKDRRIWYLAALLAVAVCVILQIMPREDTYATALMEEEDILVPFGVRLLYMFLILPADVTMTNVYCDYTYLYKASMPVLTLVSGSIVGILIWFLILYYGRRRRTALLAVLPYSLFAVFGAAVYVSLHHIGIGLLYLCFWAWVTTENQKVYEKACDTKKGIIKYDKTIIMGAVLLGTAALLVSLCWTTSACILDIGKTYAPGRNEAKFIKDHQLEQYRIMSAWTVNRDENGDIRSMDINLCDQAVNLAPYFQHNLFFNFNGGKDDRNYITHIRLTEEETQETYALWRQEEPPQVLWMSPDLMTAYDGAVRKSDYVLVYQAPVERVWKSGTDYNVSEIYVHRGLLAETGLNKQP